MKVVSDEPHPLDRHSGTGRGKELRKDGGGRKNWGNYKDDVKAEEKGYEFELKYQEKKKEEYPEEK